MPCFQAFFGIHFCTFVINTTHSTWVDAANISSGKKAIEEIALEVIAGKWGNGIERKNRLKAAGYNYSEVQKKVNELI